MIEYYGEDDTIGVPFLDARVVLLRVRRDLRRGSRAHIFAAIFFHAPRPHVSSPSGTPRARPRSISPWRIMKKSSLFDAMMSEIDIANAAVHVAREKQARLEWEMHDVKLSSTRRSATGRASWRCQRLKGDMCARFSDALWDDIHRRYR